MEYLKKVKTACFIYRLPFEDLAKRLKMSAEELTNALISGTITLNNLEKIGKCLGCCFNGWFISK